MLLIDTRRLTGPNHLSLTPLVIVELGLDPDEDLDRAARGYLNELARMRAALGFSGEVDFIVRPQGGGGVVGYEAPIDVMLACAEMSEWAVLSAVEIAAGRPGGKLEPKRTEVAAILARDRSSKLLALEVDATMRDLPFLWDDSEISIGTGKRSVTYARDSLPEPDAVPWDELGAIPTLLVTGTNGKTTSSRLLARIATEAGYVVGCTSTDGVNVGTEIVEQGDWTGPSAARVVLRRNDVDFAVLETARGGILRRGLAVDACDAALITNISDDHLGTYGVDDLAAMTRVKGVVAQIVRKTGAVVLNAHDPNLVRLSRSLASPVVFFADLESADDAVLRVLRAHDEAGKEAVLAKDGSIVRRSSGIDETLCAVDSVPITFGGAARYNVENVLGAVAMALSVGIDEDAIVRAIQRFDVADNPRRGELRDCRGVRVLLDFGHNPEGVRAVMRLVASLRKKSAGRLSIITGSAGDRSDREVCEIAKVVFDAKPDRVFVRELVDYLRGRAPGELPELFRRTLGELGFPEEAFSIVGSEVLALERIFRDAQPGDFVALLVHIDDAEVRAFLDEPVR